MKATCALKELLSQEEVYDLVTVRHIPFIVTRATFPIIVRVMHAGVSLPWQPGLWTDEGLHLTPLEATLQLRPSFDHVNEADKRKAEKPKGNTGTNLPYLAITRLCRPPYRAFARLYVPYLRGASLCVPYRGCCSMPVHAFAHHTVAVHAFGYHTLAVQAFDDHTLAV